MMTDKKKSGTETVFEREDIIPYREKCQKIPNYIRTKIGKIEFLEDRARFYYTITIRPGVHKIEEESGYRDVPYDLNHQLPMIPRDKIESHRFSHIEQYFIPHRGQMIAFVIHSWQEHSMGPNEEEIYGPYSGVTIDEKTLLENLVKKV